MLGQRKHFISGVGASVTQNNFKYQIISTCLAVKAFGDLN
jgi:hypothetical protein